MRAMAIVVSMLALAGCATPPAANVSATLESQVHATMTALASTATPVPQYPTVGEEAWVYARPLSGSAADRIPVAAKPAD